MPLCEIVGAASTAREWCIRNDILDMQAQVDSERSAGEKEDLLNGTMNRKGDLWTTAGLGVKEEAEAERKAWSRI